MSATPAAKRSRDWSRVCCGQVNIAFGDFDLFGGGLQIQESGAHVRINLPAKIFQVLARLFELRVGLQFIAVHFAALKNGEVQRAADVEDAVRGES